MVLNLCKSQYVFHKAIYSVHRARQESWNQIRENLGDVTRPFAEVEIISILSCFSGGVTDDARRVTTKQN